MPESDLGICSSSGDFFRDRWCKLQLDDFYLLLDVDNERTFSAVVRKAWRARLVRILLWEQLFLGSLLSILI